MAVSTPVKKGAPSTDTSPDDLSPLAKRIPGVKKGGDPQQFRKRELCRKTFVLIVDYLSNNEEQCPEIWSMITTQMISIQHDKPQDFYFSEAPKCVNKTDPLFRAQWLVDNSDDTISLDHIRHLHNNDERFIEDVTNMFCKWSGREPLTAECQQRAVMSKVMTRRYIEVGGQAIADWWVACWVPSSKTINWKFGGCYRFDFQDGFAIKAFHRSGKDVSIDPSEIMITDKFVIQNPCSDLNAVAVLKASKVFLCQLFPADCMEIYGKVLDKKDTAMKNYIKMATDECSAPQPGSSAFSTQPLVDHGERKRKEALVKARAKLGAKPIKRARAFDLSS